MSQMKNKNVLGKGLGALIRTEAEQTATPVPVAPSAETRDDGEAVNVLRHVDVAQVQPNPYQPRMEFDTTALQELADSIKANGLIQPITVRRFEGHYQLIAGERRLRACQIAGLSHVPAFIRDVTTAEEMIELALIENIQREHLNAIEIAQAYRRLSEECRFSQDQIAEKVGKDRSTVANFLRLLRLSSEIQESIRKDEISMGHARALLALPDDRARQRVWRRIITDALSVRAVEQIVRDWGTLAPSSHARKAPPTLSPVLRDFQSSLQVRFGTKVHVDLNEKGQGSVRFEVHSKEDFERLMEGMLGGE